MLIIYTHYEIFSNKLPYPIHKVVAENVSLEIHIAGGHPPKDSRNTLVKACQNELRLCWGDPLVFNLAVDCLHKSPSNQRRAIDFVHLGRFILKNFGMVNGWARNQNKKINKTNGWTDLNMKDEYEIVSL